MPVEQQRDSDRQKLNEAAEALGIDVAALALHQSKPEPEPEPLPELKSEALSDDEWSLIEPALLSHGRYLSKIPPRDFINAALWLAAYRFEFTLLPVAGNWSAAAVRDKIARASRAGLWSMLTRVAEQSGKMSEERLKLLARLVSYERATLDRSERLRVVRLKELAKGCQSGAGRPFSG